MPQGRSLHIALNSVDPKAYHGWSGDLAACEFDAADMRAICKSAGMTTTALLTKKATSKAVLGALDKAAAELTTGDLFLVTYSGHGGQIPDENADEGSDRLDETWVLYDRQVLDDELYQQWAKFAEGVRIVVLSDSCHSGSVVKAQLDAGDNPAILADVFRGGRFMPHDENQRDNAERKEVYDQVRASTPAEGTVPLKARVLLLSGCQDNQTSMDGPRNGAFTGALLAVWKKGAYRGGYKRFLSTIKSSMPPWQSPNYLALNDPKRRFNSERPFAV